VGAYVFSVEWFRVLRVCIPLFFIIVVLSLQREKIHPSLSGTLFYLLPFALSLLLSAPPCLSPIPP